MPLQMLLTILNLEEIGQFSRKSERIKLRSIKGGKGKGIVSNSKLICQVCTKTGHIVVNCFYRFDKSYTCANYSNSKHEKQGTHNAFVSSPYNSQYYEWYFNSGAKNHVTNQAKRFQDLTEHTCKNSLEIGNGEKLKIVASCSSKINTVNLHSVLYVPQITKNLISVSNLTYDNNAIIEFDHDCCRVKDKVT